MTKILRAVLTGVLSFSSVAAIAQQRPPELKRIPASINYIWKNLAIKRKIDQIGKE